jgi:hypothetical protein
MSQLSLLVLCRAAGAVWGARAFQLAFNVLKSDITRLHHGQICAMGSF